MIDTQIRMIFFRLEKLVIRKLSLVRGEMLSKKSRGRDEKSQDKQLALRRSGAINVAGGYYLLQETV